MSAWIFAYGSNMCLGRFLDYNVHPEAPGERARLDGYVLRFNKRSTDESGKANVEPRDGGVVWGVLYSIPDTELPILTRGEGGYTPIRRSVVRDADPVDAWVYVAARPSDKAELRPYSWYKRFVVEGAQSHGLPQEYVEALEAFEDVEDKNHERDREKRLLKCEVEISMADLLSLVVDRWKKDFKGISALEIADMLDISNEDAMARLQVLEADGTVRLRPCKLGQGIKFSELEMGGTSVKMATEFEMVDTLMAFPSRSVLEDAFHKDRVDYGVFTNRMHLGDGQIQLYYFKREVLDRYLKDPEKYEVDDDATGGDVRMTSKYFMSLSDEEQDTLGFASVRYGNMKLADGTEAIGAIAKDLEHLPKADQHHWAAHEIEDPVPSADNKSWRDFISESFEANWDADHTDYVELLATALEEINAKIAELFVKTKHPGLHLPVVNTVGEYARAHKELYKLVGADNLREDGLKELLLAHGCTEQEFVNDGGRHKGKWALFKLLASRTGLDWVAFDVVAENRIADSHKMESTSAAGEYYPARFREDLKKLIGELRKLL